MNYTLKPGDPYELRGLGIYLLGEADSWKALVRRYLEDVDCTFFDPGNRNDVLWEFRALELADIILIHYEPCKSNSKALLLSGMFFDKDVIIHIPKAVDNAYILEQACLRYNRPICFETKEFLSLSVKKAKALTQCGRSLRHRRQLQHSFGNTREKPTV